jgi:hypothetical protein
MEKLLRKPLHWTASTQIFIQFEKPIKKLASIPSILRNGAKFYSPEKPAKKGFAEFQRLFTASG